MYLYLQFILLFVVQQKQILTCKTFDKTIPDLVYVKIIKMSARAPLQARENLPQQMSSGTSKSKNDYGPDYPKGDIFSFFFN